MNERLSKRTKRWIALIVFFVVCGAGGFVGGEWWAYRSGIVGVWGTYLGPSVCFYPDHTFANISRIDGTATLAGNWYELKERDQFILVSRGGHTVAYLRRRPFHLTYSEGD